MGRIKVVVGTWSVATDVHTEGIDGTTNKKEEKENEKK